MDKRAFFYFKNMYIQAYLDVPSWWDNQLSLENWAWKKTKRERWKTPVGPHSKMGQKRMNSYRARVQKPP